jgi:glycosyltransferase involved in cell wall biosynthesis
LKTHKVLFISSWYPSRINPHLGNFNERTAEAVSQLNDVYVLNIVADDSLVDKPEFVKEHKANYKQLTVYFPKNSKENVLNKLVKKWRFLRFAKLGFNEILEEWGKPDVVHLNVLYPMGMFAYFLKRKFQLPYVATAHWTGFLQEDNPDWTGLRKLWTKRIAKQASLVCPVTEHLQLAMQKKGVEANYQVVPNVVNSDIYYPTKEKSTKSTIDFLHVSTCVDAHKNISGILRAFDELFKLNENVRLHIITENEPDEVVQLAQSIGIDKFDYLKISGPQSQHGVAEAMRYADCFVLFSNYETFSVVLAESWSCGLPAIYSRCGGLTELSNEKLGIQILPKAEKELLTALNFFIAHQANYDPAEIVKFAEQFNAPNVARQFSRLYVSIG